MAAVVQMVTIMISAIRQPLAVMRLCCMERWAGLMPYIGRFLEAQLSWYDAPGVGGKIMPTQDAAHAGLQKWVLDHQLMEREVCLALDFDKLAAKFITNVTRDQGWVQALPERCDRSKIYFNVLQLKLIRQWAGHHKAGGAEVVADTLPDVFEHGLDFLRRAEVDVQRLSVAGNMAQ